MTCPVRQSRRPLPRFVTLIGWLVVVCLALSSSAAAQRIGDRSEIDSAGLTVEASAGWDGFIDSTTPIPVSFLFQNNSDRSIVGVLTLADRLSGKETTLGEIVISPGATRRFTSIQSLRDWYECVAQLNHNGKTLWRRELGQTTGKRFDQNVNHAIIVDQGGRRPLLPGALTDANSTAVKEQEIAGREGREIRCFKVEPWQLPNHAGPLCVIQAIIFPEGTAERDLNQVQWKAVAEWMCQGGNVFVHDKSREIIDRIIDQAPLQTEAAVQSGLFMTRRFGLGAMSEYSQPILSSDADKIRQSIADAVSNLKRNYINTFADAADMRVTFDQRINAYQQQANTYEQRANRNRFLVAGFFAIYSLLTGVATFFLFRLSQKQIAGYTIFVVAGASIFSGLLGGYLRFSPGDLNWLTVTQAGIGGLVQVAAIEIQSAGSRNTRVAVKGEHADLQGITRDRYHYYGMPQNFGYSPFVWQGNQATNSDETYQINVPMSLWGRRRCHATAFKREVLPLDFEIDFERQNSANDAEGNAATSNNVPAGLISLKLVNRLPFEITNCWLVVGITHTASPQLLTQNTIQRRSMRSWRGMQQATSTSVDGLIDLYHVRRLDGLGTGATLEEKLQANFQVSQYNEEMMAFWPIGSQMPPRISRIGTASAWIIGRLKNSPILEIDKQSTDFVPHDEIHLFIQEILPEDMPDALQFTNGGK